MIHMAPTYFEKDNNFIASRDGLEKCDCIQVLMPEYRQELYQFIKNENIVYIPNIVPQYTVQLELTSPVIIFLGRIVEQKRPWLIFGRGIFPKKSPLRVIRRGGKKVRVPNEEVIQPSACEETSYEASWAWAPASP